METETVSAKPATAIQLGAARFIVLWPLVLHPTAPLSEAREIDRAVDRAAKAIRQDSNSAWRPIDDPLEHIPPPVRADFAAGTSGDAAYAAARTAWENNAYAEAVYFHEFVQSFLYRRSEAGGKGLGAFHLFGRSDLAKVRVAWTRSRGWPGEIQRDGSLEVRRLNLYLFRTGAAILALEVELDEASRASWTLADAQDFQDLFRRAYAPYFTTEKADPTRRCHGDLVLDQIAWLDASGSAAGPANERWDFDLAAATGHVPTFVGDSVAPGRRIPPIFAHWRAILPRTFEIATDGAGSDGGFLWHHVVDERMPTMALVAIADGAQYHAIRSGDMMRLCFADRSGSGDYPYDPDFLAGFDEKHAYDRFRSWGTRYLVSGYAFVIVGHGDFFIRHVGEHFRRHYFQLVMLAHLEHSSLIAFSSHITAAVGRHERFSDDQAFEVEMAAIQEEFLQFAHRFRFPTISNQVQARELFAMVRAQLDLDRLYEDVRTELSDANDYLRARAETRSAEADTRLNVLAAAGGILAVAFGLGAGDLLASLFGRVPEVFGYTDAASGLWALWETAGLLAVLAASTLLGWVVLGFVRNWHRWRMKQRGLLSSGADVQEGFEQIIRVVTLILSGSTVVVLLAAIASRPG